MLRRTILGMLATIAVSATAGAQEPVYGLAPLESSSYPAPAASADPVDALPTAAPYASSESTAPSVIAPQTASPSANFASYSKSQAPFGSVPYGGAPYGDYAQGGYVGSGYVGSGYVDGGYAGGGYPGGDCSTCMDCGCCDPCCGCGPIWRVRSSSVYMARETTDDTQLVLQDVAYNAMGNLVNANTLLNATDFEMGWETGFDISLMQGDGYGGEVEARALFLNDFSDRITGTGNNVEINNRILFLGFQPAITLNPRTNPVNVSADYLSEFRTMELNYREAFTPWWIVMIGFRYANLDEELRIRTADSAAVPLVSNTAYLTDNDMYGFQIGTEMILASNPVGWDLITTLKGGVYYNRVDLRVNSFGNGFVNGQGSFVTGETAWLGEASLQARRHFSQMGTLFLGYSMLSVDGVSLATEQTTTIVNPLQGPRLQGFSNRGTLFYHGLNIGVEIRW